MSFQELMEANKRKRILNELIHYLGYDGIAFFQMCIDEYDQLEKAVWNEGGIPHSVHFREGMQIRNWMRQQEYFRNNASNDDHYYDNEWMRYIRLALRQCHHSKKERRKRGN